jgi:NADH-quinone oxidoreductase subunit N
MNARPYKSVADPTDPITTFMAVTTKVAAFAIFLRFFAGALGFEQTDWAPALAALATITIVIGNAGAVAQRSLKRLLAWSSVAQAGYLMAGVVVNSRLGLQATMFYLAIYLLMNLACFAVVIARENVDERGDDLDAFEGLGRASRGLAWPMSLGMLSLAGFPATGGFIGKFYLINATVNGDCTWLGVVIVVGSAVSLAYYLRVIAVMWMGSITIDIPGPARRAVARVSGWSPEADASAQPEIVFVAVLAAAATIFFGLYPDPLFDVARDVGAALSGVF